MKMPLPAVQLKLVTHSLDPSLLRVARCCLREGPLPGSDSSRPCRTMGNKISSCFAEGECGSKMNTIHTCHATPTHLIASLEAEKSDMRNNTGVCGKTVGVVE